MPPLAVGASEYVQLNVEASLAGMLTNVATIYSLAADDQPGNNTVTEETLATVSVITSIQMFSADRASVEFRSSATRSYALQSSSSLSPCTWSDAIVGIAGQPGTTTVVHTNAATTSFYRIAAD